MTSSSTTPDLLQIPPLVLIGDKELMTPCETIELDPNNLKGCLEMLKQSQKHYGGIGIAACQVGWRARVFCMGIDESDAAAKDRYPGAPDFPYQIWINPTIEATPEKGTSWFWEGCLSVPGMRGWVERPNAIKICGWNENGVHVEAELDGLPARVAQHEFDHLDGILFPQRALHGTLLPVPAFQAQENWDDDFPTHGARKTKPGSFSLEK